MELFPLIPLYILIISDFRHREVSLWTLLLFGSAQVGIVVWEYGIVITGENALLNSLLCLTSGLFCVAWFSLRSRPLKGLVGSGDLLFILFITPAFTFDVFPFFMLSSFCITLAAWAICYFANRATREIPLISGIGVCYACVLVYSLFQSIKSL